MRRAHAKRPIPVALVWALLVLASIAGFALAEGFAAPHVAASVAIVLAAVKIHLVFGQYMELGWAHQPLRSVLAVWLAVVTLILLVGYWSA